MVELSQCLDPALDKKYDEFTVTVTREVSASGNVTTLLLVAIIPPRDRVWLLDLKVPGTLTIPEQIVASEWAAVPLSF